MKLLFICRAFDNVAGGVERMGTALMNEMCRRGHDVSLLTWDRSKSEAFYKFDERIAWHCLDMGDYMKKAGWGLRFKRARWVRRLVKKLKPDVMLAFQQGTFLSTRLFTFGMGIPTIAAERNAPSRFDHLKAGRYLSLIFQSFRLAKRITIQCESYRNEYPAYLRSRIVTIPNPVFPAQDPRPLRQLPLAVPTVSANHRYLQEILISIYITVQSSIPRAKENMQRTFVSENKPSRG